MKNLPVKQLVLVSCLSLAIISPPAVKKVIAWTNEEHMITNFSIPSGLNQAKANNWCQNSVYPAINRNGNFSDGAHGGVIIFAKFARPYVWGHLNLRRCVINASWGYTHSK
jgi:hypothetical protein